jgi:hypothetical protein
MISEVPADIKAVIDRTAKLVSQNPSVEPHLSTLHQNSKDYAFLNPDHPYHAYYRQTVKSIQPVQYSIAFSNHAVISVL